MCPPARQSPSAAQQLEPIASFPTADQPVSDTMLKGMLLSLHLSLQADMMSGLHKYVADIQELGERVSHV